MTNQVTARRLVQALTVVAALSALAGCYVVPLQPPAGPAASGMPPAPAVPLTFAVRLYPANDLAAAYGMVSAVVTNDLNGRGHFSTAIHGENFMGEATRLPGSRDGIANGAGNRGSYLSCRYSMNAPALGTGSCRLDNGALFTMHVGG